MRKNKINLIIVVVIVVILIMVPIIILFYKNVVMEKDSIIYLIQKSESLNYYVTSIAAIATIILGCVAYNQNEVINRNAKKPVIDIKDNSVCDGNIEMTIINNSNNDAYSISVNNNTIIADRLKANNECKVTLTFKYNKNNIKKISKKDVVINDKMNGIKNIILSYNDCMGNSIKKEFNYKKKKKYSYIEEYIN